MKNILIALDQSEDNERLIGFGLSLATQFKSKIWLVHIETPEPEFVGYEVGPQYVKDFRTRELKQEHQYLVELAERIEDRGIKTEGLLIEGQPAEMIIEEAEKLKADLIVLGSHRHSVLHNFFVGDTTESVLKKSKTPLLIVPIMPED